MSKKGKLLVYLCIFLLGLFYGLILPRTPKATATQSPLAHVCEVTSADLDRKLEHMMAEIYKLLAQRDNQIAGLQWQLFKKQGVGK